MSHFFSGPARYVPAAVGLTLIVLAVSADWLGFARPGEFGAGRVILLLAGLSALLLAWLQRRVVSVYRTTAILALNTAVIILGLELASIVMARSGILASEQRTAFQTYRDIPYYSQQDWTEDYWQEALQAEQYRYEPYVIWRHAPFEGSTIQVSYEGLRRTAGVDCSPGSYTVLVFGGSTIWGWGAPDWATIPAFLQTGLERLVERPVCVVNLGEDGFVSTQSVIELIKRLQSGAIPDAVIMYDGVNDVFAAYESGKPGSHTAMDSIAAKLEEREHPLLRWFKDSRQFWLFSRLAGDLRPGGQVQSGENSVHQERERELDDTLDAITRTYLANYRTTAALARQYCFKHFSFWQPHLAVGDKILTHEEQIIRSKLDVELSALVTAVYSRLSTVAEQSPDIWYIANVFDGEATQIWIDEWGHVTPEGNRLVAEAMLSAIAPQLAEQTPYCDPVPAR